MDKCLTPTTDMIMNLFEIENATVNANHPDFVGSADSLLNLFQDEPSGPGMVTSEATDADGQPASKTYSLLQKEKKTADELNDFNDADFASPDLQKRNSDHTLVKALKAPVPVKTQANSNPATQKENSRLESNANQELKNSMFENVFGYD